MTEQLHFHFLLSCIGERNGNPLHCSCLENPRGSLVGCHLWCCTELDMTEVTQQQTLSVLTIFCASCFGLFYELLILVKMSFYFLIIILI